MEVLPGKLVVELKPAAIDKGGAIEAFVGEAPFAGRQPWYFGDDLTDEAAFTAVQAAGGVGVKIGDGPSCALHRLESPTQLRAWLRQALDQPRRGAAVQARRAGG
ncbi:MAG: trehalose-phosphatase [Thiomonas sp.]